MANKKKSIKVSDHDNGVKRLAYKAKPHAVKLLDLTLKLAAAVYLIATSLLYTRDWLREVEVNDDIALAGAIAVTSIVLYLTIRKR